MSGRHDDDMGDLDPRLGRALHDVFDARDPGPAPRTLHDRVDRVPERSAEAAVSRRPRVAGALVAVAGLAAALLVVAVLAPLLLGTPPGPAASALPSAGVSPGPMPTTPADAPYPDRELDARVIDFDGERWPIDPLTALPVVAVIAGAVVLGWLSAHRRRRPDHVADGRTARPRRLSGRGLAVAWLGLAGLAVVTVAASQPLGASVSAWGGTMLVDSGIAAQDADGRAIAQVTAPNPGQVSSLDIVITNRGLLPVVVEGPATWDSPGLPIQPERFIEDALVYEEALALPASEPVLLWPAHSIHVRVAYRHLACEAWGIPASPASTPWPTIAPDGTAIAVPGDTPVVTRTDLPLEATVLGVPRTLSAETGFGFGMVVPTTCPPTQPMAVADLSNVPADLSMRNGQGLYTAEMAPETGQTWIILVDAVIVIGAFGSFGWLVRRRRIGAVVVLVVAGGVVWWTVQPASLSSDPTDLVGQGQVWGSADGVPTTFDVGSGGVLTFGFTVHNDDLVPVTLLGVEATAGQLRLTGLGQPWGTPSATPADNAALFTPTQIDGGGTLELLGQATAGSCTRALAQPHDAWIHLRAIPFTYERLGLRQTTLVPLASSIRVPGDAACLASAAMASDGREAWFPVRTPVAADPVFLGGIGSWLLAGMAILLTVAFLRRRDRRRGGTALAGAVVLGGWLVFGFVIPVRVAVYDVVPDIGTVTNPNDSEQNALFVNAGPDEAFSFGLLAGTDGLLPVTVMGVSSAAGQGPWTGIWSSTVYPSGDLDAPNQPIGPDGRLLWSDLGLWITGTADECAVPFPDPTQPPQVALAFTSAPVALQVEILGIRRTVELDPRTWPSMPLSTDCLDAAGRSD